MWANKTRPQPVWRTVDKRGPMRQGRIWVLNCLKRAATQHRRPQVNAAAPNAVKTLAQHAPTPVAGGVEAADAVSMLPMSSLATRWLRVGDRLGWTAGRERRKDFLPGTSPRVTPHSRDPSHWRMREDPRLRRANGGAPDHGRRSLIAPRS